MLADGSYGRFRTGLYVTAGGDRFNLDSGEFALSNGTTGNVFSAAGYDGGVTASNYATSISSRIRATGTTSTTRRPSLYVPITRTDLTMPTSRSTGRTASTTTRRSYNATESATDSTTTSTSTSTLSASVSTTSSPSAATAATATTTTATSSTGTPNAGAAGAKPAQLAKHVFGTMAAATVVVAVLFGVLL
jgi:hypothetical protein